MPLKIVEIEGMQYVQIDERGHVIYVDDEGKETGFDAASLAARLDEVNGESASRQREIQDLNERLETFQDLDPDEVRRALEAIKAFDDKQLIDAGEVEKIRQEAIEGTEPLPPSHFPTGKWMGIDNLAFNPKSGSSPSPLSDCNPSNSGENPPKLSLPSNPLAFDSALDSSPLPVSSCEPLNLSENPPGKWMSCNGLAFNPKPNSQSGILFFGFKGFAFNQKADYSAISVIAWPRKIFVDLAGVKRRSALIPLSESLARRVLEGPRNALQCLDDFLRVTERNYMRGLEAKVVELQGKLDSEMIGNVLTLHSFHFSLDSLCVSMGLARSKDLGLGLNPASIGCERVDEMMGRSWLVSGGFSYDQATSARELLRKQIERSIQALSSGLGNRFEQYPNSITEWFRGAVIEETPSLHTDQTISYLTDMDEMAMVSGKNPECLYFNAVVDQKSSYRLMRYFQEAMTREVDEIHLFLNTAGGLVNQGFMLYNFIRALPIRVVTYNMDQVGSIGNVIYQGGDLRVSLPGARFTLHGASQVMNGVKFASRSAERGQILIDKIMTERTHLDEDEINAAHSGELCLSATEALERGITDEVRCVHFPSGLPFSNI